MEWAQVAYVVLGVVLGAIATLAIEALRERKRRRAERESEQHRGVVGLRQRSRQALDNIEAAYELRRAGRDGWQALLRDAREYAYVVEYRFIEFGTVGPDQADASALVNQLFRRLLGLVTRLEQYEGAPRDKAIESEMKAAWEERERLRRLLMTAFPSDPVLDPLERGVRDDAHARAARQLEAKANQLAAELNEHRRPA